MKLDLDILKDVPLFADLDEIERLQVMACFSLQQLAAGEILYAEGDQARSACFVIKGELEALTALPGGGKALVGVIGTGEMIGEMALIAGGNRTATVRARTDVTVVSVSFAFFQAALNQMSVAAFKLLRRIMHSLACRLEAVHNSIFSAWDCDGYCPKVTGTGSGDPLEKFETSQITSFDYRPYLGILPFFDEFEQAEIELILAAAAVMEIPRNEFLYREGTATGYGFVLVRGAVDKSIMRDRRYQLSVLGPGRLCGSNALISKKSHHCDARVRSDALVLRFDAENFERLFNGTGIEALKFQARVSHNQLLELKAADNLLTTLISQAHVRDSSRAPS